MRKPKSLLAKRCGFKRVGRPLKTLKSMKSKTIILSFLFVPFFQLSFSQTAGPNGTVSYDIKGANVYYANGAILSVFSGVASPSAVGGSITLTPGNGYSSNGTINLNGNTILNSTLSVTGSISAGSFSTTASISAGNITATGTISAANLNITTGSIGIGTTNYQGYKLAVNGGIIAEEVKVVTDVPASDYVFKKDYKLMNLSVLEKFVSEHQHLPGVQSAEEFKKNGYTVGQMDNMLLKKVEEITLYLIELKKENERLTKEVEKLKKQ